MLKIENLSKVFHKNEQEEKYVFRNLNLNVKKGEFVAIIGENGTGKSTLMNLISGSELPNGGSILLDDTNITFLPEYKRSKFIGRVFQDPLKGTAPNLTIEENLSIAIIKNSKKNLLMARNKQNIEFFKCELEKLNLGLENRLNSKVGMLSGGQRQALALLMATIIQPKILLLDEHTAALDPKSCKKILELTQKITSQNKDMITLMITHNMKDALDLGTRTVMLSGGKVVKDITEQNRKRIDSQNVFNYNAFQNK